MRFQFDFQCPQRGVMDLMFEIGIDFHVGLEYGGFNLEKMIIICDSFKRGKTFKWTKGDDTISLTKEHVTFKRSEKDKGSVEYKFDKAFCKQEFERLEEILKQF